MKYKKYKTTEVIINNITRPIPDYKYDLSDVDNFTLLMNRVKYIIHTENKPLHTIRIAENIPHLLYNRNNTYDTQGRYRYGYEKGPIIEQLRLSNCIYLYDDNNSIIGRINISEFTHDVLSK